MIDKQELNVEITTQELVGDLGKTIEIIPPKTQEKSCVPTTEAQEIIPDETYTGLSKVSVGAMQLEEKNITITTNTTTVIEPSQGKDGLSSVSITTEIEGDPSEFFESTIGAGSGVNTGLYYAIKKLPSSFTVNGNSLAYAFYGYCGGGGIPMLVNSEQVTNWAYCFSATSFSNIDNLANITFNRSITSTEAMFSSFNSEEINLPNLGQIDTGINCTRMFAYSKAKRIDLSNFEPTGNWTGGYMFQRSNQLEYLDISKLNMRYNLAPWYVFEDVPRNCLILVKDQDQVDWFATNCPNLTNVQIKSEYIANQGA